MKIKNWSILFCAMVILTVNACGAAQPQPGSVGTPPTMLTKVRPASTASPTKPIPSSTAVPAESATASPAPTDRAQAADPSGTPLPETGEEAVFVFDPATANQVRPDEIIEEIDFYPGGGDGVFCPVLDPFFPMIQFDPSDGEIMRTSTMVTCGWRDPDSVKGSILYPDGRVITQPVHVEEFGESYYAWLPFRPSLTDPEGVYKYILEGSEGRLESNAYFHDPEGPRLYNLGENIVFYRFNSNEAVRLFYYKLKRTGVILRAWQSPIPPPWG